MPPSFIKQLPNILTTLRLLLAVPIVLLIVNESYALVLGVAFLAGASDGVDGWIARRYHAQSRYGVIVDPLADKVLLVSTFISLAFTGVIPHWVAILVVARDLVIVCGALIYHWLIGRYDMAPSFWGKASTLMQIVFALVVLTQQVTPIFNEEFVRFLLWLLAGLAIISGGNYVSVWSQKAWTEYQQRRAS